MLRSATGPTHSEKACVDSTGEGQDTYKAQFLSSWVFTTRLPKIFPFSWEYLKLRQTSHPEKQGYWSWKPLLGSSIQEIHQEIHHLVRSAGAPGSTAQVLLPSWAEEGWWESTLLLSWFQHPSFSLWTGTGERKKVRLVCSWVSSRAELEARPNLDLQTLSSEGWASYVSSA